MNRKGVKAKTFDGSWFSAGYLIFCIHGILSREMADGGRRARKRADIPDTLSETKTDSQPVSLPDTGKKREEKQTHNGGIGEGGGILELGR